MTTSLSIAGTTAFDTATQTGARTPAVVIDFSNGSVGEWFGLTMRGMGFTPVAIGRIQNLVLSVAPTGF